MVVPKAVSLILCKREDNGSLIKSNDSIKTGLDSAVVLLIKDWGEEWEVGLNLRLYRHISDDTKCVSST